MSFSRKNNMQISWLHIPVQSRSWSLDVTRSDAGETRTFTSLLHSFSFDRQDTRKRFLKGNLVSTLNRTAMGHCILFLSVIWITLVAFSSGKQYRLVMTEFIILSIEHSYSCKRNKYRTYTFFNGSLRTNRNLQQISACIQEILWKHRTNALISVPSGKT